MVAITYALVAFATLASALPLSKRQGTYDAGKEGAKAKANLKAAGADSLLQGIAATEYGSALKVPDSGTNGGGKTGDSANFGVYNQNWYDLRTTCSQFQGQSAGDYNNGKVLDGDNAAATKCFNELRGKVGDDKAVNRNRYGCPDGCPDEGGAVTTSLNSEGTSTTKDSSSDEAKKAASDAAAKKATEDAAAKTATQYTSTSTDATNTADNTTDTTTGDNADSADTTSTTDTSQPTTNYGTETYDQQQAREKAEQASTQAAQQAREKAEQATTQVAQQEREKKQHEAAQAEQTARESAEHAGGGASTYSGGGVDTSSFSSSTDGTGTASTDASSNDGVTDAKPYTPAVVPNQYSQTTPATTTSTSTDNADAAAKQAEADVQKSSSSEEAQKAEEAKQATTSTTTPTTTTSSSGSATDLKGDSEYAQAVKQNAQTYADHPDDGVSSWSAVGQI